MVIPGRVLVAGYLRVNYVKGTRNCSRNGPEQPIVFWICCQSEGNLALLLKHICVEAAVMINKTEETIKKT